MQQADLIQAIAELIVEEVPQVKVDYTHPPVYGSIVIRIQDVYVGVVHLGQDVLYYHYYDYNRDFKLSDPECFRQLGRAIIEQFKVWRCNKII